MTLPTSLDERFRAAAAAEGLLDAGYDVYDSPVGPLFVAATPRGVCRISYDADVDRQEARLAETMRPGSVAAVLVYENLWAAPFGSAVRHAGGQLIASGRIPVQAIIAAVEADAALAAQGA